MGVFRVTGRMPRLMRRHKRPNICQYFIRQHGPPSRVRVLGAKDGVQGLSCTVIDGGIVVIDGTCPNWHVIQASDTSLPWRVT
jgi:hypothetical protein